MKKEVKDSKQLTLSETRYFLKEGRGGAGGEGGGGIILLLEFCDMEFPRF